MFHIVKHEYQSNFCYNINMSNKINIKKTVLVINKQAKSKPFDLSLENTEIAKIKAKKPASREANKIKENLIIKP